MDNGASSYRRFHDGDESAFDETMKEVFDNLVFFVDRYVHNNYAAEDIAIDAFWGLVVNKHWYNFEVILKNYLFTLGHSCALNHIKHTELFSNSALFSNSCAKCFSRTVAPNPLTFLR